MIKAGILLSFLLLQQADDKPPVVNPVKVDEAIKKGVQFLRAQEANLKEWGGLHGQVFHTQELVLLTLVHAGIKADDPYFIRLFKSMMDAKLENTYRVALQAMVLEEVDRVRYQWRILQCAQFLADNMLKNGQWSYGSPTFAADDMPTGDKRLPDIATETKGGKKKVRKGKPRVRRRIPVKPTKTGKGLGDNSNTQYAALGIRACFDAGIVFPKSMIRKAKQWWERSQKDSGGYCYMAHKDHEAYGSMSAGAVGCLAIYNYVEGRNWRRDRATQKALLWLSKNFSVKFNPGVYEHGKKKDSQTQFFYYMYAMERAGLLYGTEKMGKHWWYAEGAEELLNRQKPNGAWGGGYFPRMGVIDTCFAILFLRRATEPLDSVASGDKKKRR